MEVLQECYNNSLTNTSHPYHSHPPNDPERRFIKAMREDDKSYLLTVCRATLVLERETVRKLFKLTCLMDSVECATALLGGEVGVVPLLNELDQDEGLAPLHLAARANAARVVHLLLNKRARTDLKTRDNLKLLPLQIALSSVRKEIKWSITEEGNSVEELMYELRQKDLTVVKLLSDKTKEIGEVAHSSGITGRIVELGALLMVAAEKVIGCELDLHDNEVDCKQKTSVYERVIREALAHGHLSKSPKGKSHTTETSSSDEKRKLLLAEIELLQLFGAVSRTTHHSNPNNNFLSPLIRASQVGDEDVIKLLLSTRVDINDVDAEGNSALHWCLKTSKGSCPEQIKNMCLLLKHDARVGQKNKLGLTAVHIAAANGNAQALQLLLLKDPDCVNFKSEMKETPLFSAVKNNHKDCAGILLRLGANTEVLNLRRQRPIDLAESEDMRLMLRPTNISLTNHTCPMKHIFWLQGDEVISESCEEITRSNSKGNTTDSGKTQLCKYFDSPKGCVRGSKCFYLHAEEELKPKRRTDMLHSSIALSEDLKRKIFVRGLPPSLDSDSLGKIFEEQFGSVDDAMVVGAPAGGKMVSRGFGFVVFKEENSVSAAVAARQITIMGKEVEIRSAIPKGLLLAGLQLSDQDELLAGCSKKKITRKNIVCRDEKPGSNVHSLQAPIEKAGRVFSHDKNNAEVKSELLSWVHRLIHGQPKVSVAGLKLDDKKRPSWLKTFEKWLPRFIRYVSKNEGEYALSSLKADFRGAFGLELDHASLGFPKLSDFMKCFPDICEIKFVPLGKQKSANHMVLMPAKPKHGRKPLRPLSVNNIHQAESTDDNADDDCQEIESVEEILLVSNENDNFSGNSLKVHQEIPDDNLDDVSFDENSGFLQFLKPDPIFHARPWLNSNCDAGTKAKPDQLYSPQKMKSRSPPRHAVLEALAKRNNNTSVFLLREYDFYEKYRACMKQGKCFGCKRPQVLWANYPCMHLLWCSDCKLQAARACGNLEHKCVVCDTKVEKIYLTTFHEYCQSVGRTSPIKEFPPFDPDYLRNLCRNKSSMI